MNGKLTDLCLSSTSESKFADSCCTSDSSTGCVSWQGDAEKSVSGSIDRQTYNTSDKSAADNACMQHTQTLHLPTNSFVMATRQLCWLPAILFYRCHLDLYSFFWCLISEATRWSVQSAYNDQLLQLLRALPSGSIVSSILVFFKINSSRSDGTN